MVFSLFLAAKSRLGRLDVVIPAWALDLAALGRDLRMRICFHNDVITFDEPSD